MSGRAGGRASRRPAGPTRPRAWLLQHLQSLLATLGQLVRAPLATGLTVAVISIALALPAGFLVLTGNLRALAAGWDQAAAISLFLRHAVDDAAAERLAATLRSWPELARVRLITRAEALAEFRDLGGFEAALSQLETNPLPVVLALYPTAAQQSPEALAHLEQRVRALPETEFARVDTLWLQRLRAILALLDRAALVLAGLLGLGVLLIVGNTIRLEILNRRHEIAIMELVGATPAFIRRPFLHAGFWYGAFGGLGAWLLVNLAVLPLRDPAARLASLYRGEFPLSGLGLHAFVLTLIAGILLGLVGSGLAVNRHLREVAPD